MKELLKPKKRRVVFEKIDATALGESGNYYDSYSRGRDGVGNYWDQYTRGTEIDSDSEILF